MRAGLFTLKAAIGSLIVMQALVLAGIAILVINHFPDNHTALEIRLCYIPPALAVTLALATSLRIAWFMRMACAGSILFLFLLVLIDSWNVLVQYDEWCHRGMPASVLTEWSVPKSPR